jgi:hypothetical protein
MRHESPPNWTVLDYAGQSLRRRRKVTLYVLGFAVLYCTTYLALHWRGYYHAYYDDGAAPGVGASVSGWQIEDETGIAILDRAFRPAIVAERIVRNRFCH